MEEMPPAAALPFRTGNSLRENPMDVARLRLISDAATLLLSDPMAADIDHVPAAKQEEEVVRGDGDELEVGTIPSVGSDEEDSMSVGAEPSVGSSIGDSSSIASAADELPSLDPSAEGSVDAALSVDIAAGPSFTVAGPPAVAEPAAGRGGGGGRSVFLTNYVPLWGCVSICGRRPEMEDAVVAVPWFFEIPLRMLTSDDAVDGLDPSLISLPAHFFGVYDGHGGAQVANYCRDRVHLALVEELRNVTEGLGGESGDAWKRQWERVFVDCFQKVDDEVGGKVRRGNVGGAADASEDGGNLCSGAPLEPAAPETVGSTAVVAVICSSHIIIANCGDSRAVLCRGKQAVPLSVDHKPNREDEYARIEAEGGKVIQWNGYRVFGVLAMSRSIGDQYLKPWIIPVPEVTIVPRTKEDDCLILASDGLWDVMSNEEVCEVARKRILHWHKKNGVTLSPTQRGEEADPAAQAAADCLSKHALQKGSKDNITAVVVDLKAQRKFKTKT
ncbi:probable protein phosphatase 2C 6 [Elaeis guineensis]|uniref:protein-serine/threonine phosphatase n=1 Tax=Elaeis guineensis var. tenera TaxID=51953 RepID=A0A6I9S5G8_ELAGV|nr:probable protein phosphatase 2C 6 [Elaeis guineensis]